MINIIRMLTIDEGLRNYCYKDTKGKVTVGIGFNMDDPHARGVWVHANIAESFLLVYQGQQALSTASAWKIVTVQIEDAKKDALSIFPDFEIYPENIKLVLVNLMFNMGKAVFSQFNTFISLIKQHNYTSAAIDLEHTLWAKEVPNRAKRIVALLGGNDSLYANA